MGCGCWDAVVAFFVGLFVIACCRPSAAFDQETSYDKNTRECQKQKVTPVK